MQIRDRKDWWAASIPLALLTVLAAVLAGTAWLCDDAYISLRVADNWANGYGLRWNVDERVQVFTHPLWLILLAIGRLLSGEVYYSSLLLSIALSLLAAAAAFALARTTATGMLAIGLLLSSRAWTDFSTSGLENPLIHLLLAFHVWGYTRTTGRQRLLLQTLSASLLATTRMDALLLALPSLLAATVGVPRRQVARMLFLGAAPFLLWELFSLIYYGALFPNTAYAKLGSGIPRAQLVIQGCFYLVDSLRRDPLTLAVITTVAVHAIWRSPQLRPLAAGMVVYLLYVVVVGGDFMSGRLLTPVLFLAVLLLAAQTVLGTPLRRWAVVASLLVCNALVYLAPRDGGWFHGIADERSYYFPHTGLIRALSGDNVPDHPWVDKGRACNAAISKEGTTTPTVFMDGAALQDRAGKGGALMIEHNVGMLGYFAGPAVHIVDVLALTDPMLARLPAYEDSSWRVGHYQRILPTGYITTLLTDENHFGDTSVAHLYSTLRERTQGEIFSWSRARQIVASVLGIDTQPIDFGRRCWHGHEAGPRRGP